MSARWSPRGLAAWAVLLLFAGGRAIADDVSTDARLGIHSQGLGLTGAGVGIGQVESERPGRAANPPMDDADHSNTTVLPRAVFDKAGPPIRNVHVDNHAEGVAGVMIARGVGAPASVAPDAALFAGAAVSAGVKRENIPLTAQNLIVEAARANLPLRAINISAGVPVPDDVSDDGSDQISRFVDWSSRKHNVLYVVAGEEGGFRHLAPQDAFNQIVVGFTQRDGKNSNTGPFHRVDGMNTFVTTSDGRTELDIVAPGANIRVSALGTSDGKPATRVANGTSEAAPHVTGTVALLQEFANAHYTGAKLMDAQRHEVMKAVLMNSADKFTEHNGTSLGMEKTILNTSGKDWFETHAATRGANDKTAPLDDELGTGQLNAFRAVRQLAAGEHHTANGVVTPVPLIGWDYFHTVGPNDNEKYLFNKALGKDQWVSITLAWDHLITKTDKDGKDNNNTPFTATDKFKDGGQENLDLFLLPKGSNNINQAVWSSESTLYTVEHLFFQIQNAGQYEFWVHDAGGPVAGGQDYGLAWQATPVPEPSSVLLMIVGAGGLLLIGRARAARPAASRA